MTEAVCPYCRCPIDEAADEQLVCTGCSTPHHTDCYAENGGCTVFGCSAAPADESKLSVSGTELAAASSGRTYTLFPTAGTASSVVSETMVMAPPPPPPANGSSVGIQQGIASHYSVGNVLFAPQATVTRSGATPLVDFDFTPDPDAKNRMTFIILGVLLGMLGAHNFYAGYRGKAYAQLCISVLTLGFASPMSWVWAVIDVCTIDEDSGGVKFRS